MIFETIAPAVALATVCKGRGIGAATWPLFVSPVVPITQERDLGQQGGTFPQGAQ